MLGRRLIFFVLTAALAMESARAEDNCPPKPVATLPMVTVDGGRFAVMASISGHPVRLEVDTGASDSLLTERTADSLGLERAKISNRSFNVLSGASIREYVIAKDVVIGNIKSDKMKFPLLPSNSSIDGLLGADVLSHFDVEFDFAEPKLVLFKQSRCGTKAVYWAHSDDITAIPFNIELTHIVFPVKLEGKQIIARLDTGAWNIDLSLEGAKSLFGLDENSPDMRRLGRPDNPHPSYLHKFRDLLIGNRTITEPDVRLMVEGSTQMADGPRLQLGMPVLRRFHMYIAYREQMLYFTAADSQ